MGAKAFRTAARSSRVEFGRRKADHDPRRIDVVALPGPRDADWLRALARSLHDELGGPGVGVLGMCFTGGFALAMMADRPIVAPVLAQPSVPFAIGKARGAALDLSSAVATRFTTLREQLGDKFIAVEFPGKQHSTLTEHRQQEGVERVLEFFRERLTTT